MHLSLLLSPLLCHSLRPSSSFQHQVQVNGQQPVRQRLGNSGNTQYFGHIEVGGQDLTAIYDTGSFEILVISDRCDECRERKHIKPYSHELSEFYRENGTVTQHIFGSGPVMSIQGYDRVKVGPLIAENQSFWEIVKHGIQILDYAKFNAIVGVGPGHAPNNEEHTLLMSFGVKQFSVCLERPQVEGKRVTTPPGWLNWHEKTDANFQNRDFYVSVRVVGEHHWAVKMHSFRVGEAWIDQVCTPTCAAIVDSGTSLLAAPSRDLQILSEAVGEISENCTNLEALPSIQFQLDGSSIELGPEAYLMKLEKKALKESLVLDKEAGIYSWALNWLKLKMLKTSKTSFLQLKERQVAFDSLPPVVCLPAFMKIEKESQFGSVWILGMPFFPRISYHFRPRRFEAFDRQGWV